MVSENPQHLAIILDGNRRFAKRLMLEPWKGHEFGAKKVGEFLDFVIELGIKQTTFYCLSSENIKSRPKNELDYLYKLFKKEFKNLDREKIEKNKIKIRFIGNLDLIPENLKKQCESLEKQTEKNNNFIINFAIAYGGRQEIVEAVKKILANKLSPDEIDEQTIMENLWLSSEPDLIIRTSESRLSGFLLFQGAYSEIIFLPDKLWPELTKEDLKKCILEYKKRKKRFGE